MPFDQMMFDATPQTDEEITRPEPFEGDEVIALFRTGARIIRERGWCQFDQGTKTGPVCIGGAFFEAAFGDPMGPILDDRRDVARKAVILLYRQLGLSITDKSAHIRWNNAPGRTASEVITALESAADTRARALRKG